jgi:hypothetical protein
VPRGFLPPHLRWRSCRRRGPLQDRGAGFHMTVGTFATCRLRRATSAFRGNPEANAQTEFFRHCPDPDLPKAEIGMLFLL